VTIGLDEMGSVDCGRLVQLAHMYYFMDQRNTISIEASFILFRRLSTSLPQWRVTAQEHLELHRPSSRKRDACCIMLLARVALRKIFLVATS
jgi:hypothetical protein